MVVFVITCATMNYRRNKMKVLAINGSPHAEGNTFHALRMVCMELNKHDIETEIITIGKMKMLGCTACGSCSTTGHCVLNDGNFDEIALKMCDADGILIGSPVYYAGINGTLKSFLDRAFYVYSKHFRFKPCAAVVAMRREGTMSALQTINNYFMISEMMIVPTNYWSGVYGGLQAEVLGDLEGHQMMEVIGRNMAYMLKMKAESKVKPPERVQKIKFNYIR